MASGGTHNYQKELQVASLAISRASVLVHKLSSSIVKTRESGTVTKEDKSPVTIGDLAAQAIVNHAIKLNFPDDEIVGEEDSNFLREYTDESKALSKQIFDIIQDAQKETSQFDEKVGDLKTIDEIYDSIDAGNSEGGSTKRVWALDPIDGTKGFLRGDQFAVCLALIDKGKVVLGVIGCPNLPENIESNEKQFGTRGGLFSAIEGLGSYYVSLFNGKGYTPLSEQQQINMKQTTSPNELKVLEGVEKGHSSHSTQSLIKSKLGLNPDTVADQTINLDSQVKYCVLAKGQADVYLRLPVNDTYREKIWDHAAGNILIRESGGRVGDLHGSNLDFGQGRYLKSKGVIASNSAIFPKIIHAISEVL